MRLAASALITAFLTGVVASPVRADQTYLVPPVDGAIVRGFDAPEVRWGPGHRGIDYAAPPGTSVRAAGRGRVSFAGAVAGVIAVTITHEDGLQTTYSMLDEVWVSSGDWVDEGTWIGTVGAAHDDGIEGDPPDGGLHFGVKLEGAYVDPSAYLGPLDVSDAIALAPLAWRPGKALPEPMRAWFGAGTHERPCGPIPPPDEEYEPPNDNIAVAVAGLGSRTRPKVDAAMYEFGPETLGYPARRVYRFSYRSPDGPRGHRPYTRTDTFGDISVAAGRLSELLAKIARRHPDRDVDLIAHSQGGVVARAFLSMLARAWDPDLPRVEHLLTFATPHGGAPLAGEAHGLDNDTFTGGFALDGLSAWSRRGGAVPDPRSVAVRQLAPDSALMSWMAAEDVSFGTRVLALGAPNDYIVPADRALWPDKPGHIVPPAGLWGHDAIVRSPVAQALARNFLSDGAPACRSGWDLWGPRVGRFVGWMESKVSWLYKKAEKALGGRFGPAGEAAVDALHRARAGRLIRSSKAYRWNPEN